MTEIKWIPVTKEIPSNRRNVLIATDKGVVAEGFYSRCNNNWVAWRWELDFPKVVAWAELPKYEGIEKTLREAGVL